MLLANLGPLSLYELLTDAQKQALPTAAFDRVAVALMHLLVDGKAITVFSLLFGVGFALQLERGGREDSERTRIFLRRIVVLLAIGLAHAYFVWWGDILVWYTDGIVECENAAGEEYGEKRFRASVRRAAALDSGEIRDAVVADAGAFFGETMRKDDITLVIGKIY